MAQYNFSADGRPDRPGLSDSRLTLYII